MMTLLILFFPLLSSLLVFFSGNKLSRVAAITTSLVNLVITYIAYQQFKSEGAASFYYFKEWIHNPHISIHFAIDGLSMLMVILTNFITSIILLTTFNREITDIKSYLSLILFMQFALIGVFISMDGIVYYIFWELALIPIYFIALIWGGVNRVKVTLKFFIYTLAGSMLMLFGFIMLYFYNPSHSFDIRDLYNHTICACNQSWIFWLFFIAFAIKIPIVPFHTWQADTYKEAPTQGTMLLSGIMLKMGTYSLIRWLLPIFPAAVQEWTPLIIVLCVVGIVYASVIAIMQRDLKKLFAYSSVAHVGLISAGIFTLTSQGLVGSAVQMFAHAVNVVGLFYCADIILKRTGTNQIENLGGIRQVSPWFATLFMIVLLGSVALPLTNGFIGEFMLLYAVFEYNTWLSVFAGLTIILGAVYMLRMFQLSMLGNENTLTGSFGSMHWNEVAILSILGITIFVTGVYPKPLLELIEPDLQMILNKALLAH